MAVQYSFGQIVTSGLVLALDAADRNSYPGSGTVWTDLSGNNNTGTLTNGPTFSSANGGSIVFDGVDDYAATSNTFALSTATFIAWINQNGTQPTFTGIMYSRVSEALATGIGTSYNTNNQLGYTWNGAINTYSWNSGLIIPNNTWCMIALTVSTTNAIAYLYQSSGVTSATNTVSHSSVSSVKFDIARDSFNSSRFFKGNIANAQIYNRALSATEVLQNYNAQKSRFNL